MAEESPKQVQAEPSFYRFDENTDLTKALTGFRSFHNIDPPNSSMPELNWDQYSFFRPSEAMPVRQADIMNRVMDIYKKCNIIRNIIDLMGDFTSQGMRISHPQQSRDKFYKEWYQGINKEGNIGERIANYLYKTGNVFIKRRNGKITVRRNGEDFPKIVPIDYEFINPAIVKADSPELNSIIGKHKYYIDLAPISEDIKKQLNIEKDKKYLDDSFILLFYKKDDWEPFAIPITYGMIKDASMLDKLDLADRTALDSAINHIRIYKLGSLEHKIIPGPAAFEALDKMLQANKGSGCTNILWGDGIELIESNSEFYKFLGWEKYEPPIERIYQGAGIRTTKGNSGGAGAFLSLSVILQRMAYGRSIVDSFFREELERVRVALGDTVSAEIEYDIPNLTDENAHKALVVQLADRNLISDELVQHTFKHNPKMESVRINREESQRDSGKKARKVGPYTDKDFEKSLVKMAMSTQTLDMDTLLDHYGGLDGLEFKDPPQKAAVGPGGPGGAVPKKGGGQPQQGRPQNSNDKSKRSRRTLKPVKSATIEIWASGVYDKITSAIKPCVLQNFNKGTLRELTASEFKEYEDLKTGILFNMEYGSDDVESALSQPINIGKINYYKDWVSQISKELKRELSTNEKVKIQAVIYAQFI